MNKQTLPVRASSLGASQPACPPKVPEVQQQLTRLAALVEETLSLVNEVETRFQTVVEPQATNNSDDAKCEPPIPNRVDSLLNHNCNKLERAHAVLRNIFERALV